MDTPLPRVLIREINDVALKMYEPHSPDLYLFRPYHFQQYEGLYYEISDQQGLFHDTINDKWIVLYNNTASNDAWKSSKQEAEKYAKKWSAVYDSITHFFSECPGGILLDAMHTDQINSTLQRLHQTMYIFRQKNTLFAVRLDEEQLPFDTYVLKPLKSRLVLASLNGGPTII